MNDKQEVTKAERQSDTPALLPRVDVFEDGAGITLLADLPGVAKDKLTLRVEGDTLQLEGEISPETPANMEAVYAELRLPRYRRAFTLSSELDTDKVEAQFKDGVLTLRIPKHAHAQPRKIEVKIA
ncbi:Hsp20/alpha crystallin family protein [Azoarcus sp. PA01]|nr:Hsp20/alpha crystallin family protein [Azoarcus sp. PA01]